VPHPDIRCSGIIPWYKEVLRIKVLIYSPGCPNLLSLYHISIHYTTSGSQLFTCRHSRTRTLDSRSVPAVKRHCPVSPVELLKISPESRTFQNIIYEPHVWGERGSFSVAFLKFSYKTDKDNTFVTPPEVI
jgi:hypothetical protein